ncbi:hypothetical protein GUJ93_ZPchr0003g17147 [Zizania palustris]|uniref:DUF4408 domain-containing protein n=1 Tax=Zizania palustris TaxID=103762 RepID=A0A8J5VY37_ZIZPA|nr:hypothetical protein GUJ93_ZPchr0003g17147 [Zizania palustris]
MEGKAVPALLLLLLPVVLLLQPPRALAENLSVGVLDIDIAASWSRLLDLLTRGNIILLCNAILLIVLWDAGILASPAHYHGGRSSVAAADSPVAASASASSRTRRRLPKEPNAIVVWRRIEDSAGAGAGAADNVDRSDVALNSRLRHRLHRPEQATRALRRTEEEKQRSEVEIAMAESKSSSFSNSVTTSDTMSPRALPPTGAPKQSSACLDYPDDQHAAAAAAAGEVAMADDHESSLCSEPDHSAGPDTDGICEDEAPDQFADDVDDMNRRFEEFIANTRRKMLLESMQLVLEV